MGGIAWSEPIYASPAPQAASTSETTAKGVVKDEFGDPMIGASVRVANNPSQGAATNIDGEFSITNVKPGTKLLITSVGYKNLEVVWNGTPIDVDMELNTKVLDNVVVTAMGIKREEKTLTYAVQTIKADEVTRIKETNFINSLQGKSAGLTITPNNSGENRTPRFHFDPRQQPASYRARRCAHAGQSGHTAGCGRPYQRRRRQ